MDSGVLDPHNDTTVLISRIFAVAASVLLVGAFALGVLAPDGMTLDQGVASMGHNAIAALRHGVQRVLGAAGWTHVFMPLLVRPIWLIPFCLGMICAGLAATLGAPGHSQRRPHTGG